MFFFNLSLAEFMALFTAASAVVVALYLLDRSRRRVTVSTLRFWTAARKPVESTSRRRIRQWPSLLLQLASIALLLLALSQLRIGSPDTASRDHVIVMDTSTWMSALDERRPLIDEARRQALAYVKVLPPEDRVMVVHADAMATPATAFETDRRKIEAAIRDARPGSAALDLRQALDFAVRAQARGAKRRGEIVFAGAGRMLTTEGAGEFVPPANLRVLAVDARPENVGLRKIGLEPSTTEGGLWRLLVSVRNYGGLSRPVDLALQFGGAPIGSRTLRINGGEEQEAAFEFRTRAAGIVEARIRARGDAFPADDRAVLELPALPIAPVFVCGTGSLLKPLLDAHPSVQATYKQPGECLNPPPDAIVIGERFVPRPLPKRAILVDPPAGGSPIPAKPAGNVTLDRWLPEHPLSAGLHTKDFRLEGAQVFTPAADDVRIAETSAGPVAVARGGLVVLGFHPMQPSLRYELATPLLFANILRWVAPGQFRRSEVYASAVGGVTVPIDAEPGAAPVEVKSGDGTPLPYSVQGKSLRFYSGRPGTVRVRQGDVEQIYSMTLPGVPESVWTIPREAKRGVPRARDWGSSSRDIWHWLALLGGLGLLAEWLLFAPSDRRKPASAPRVESAPELRKTA